MTIRMTSTRTITFRAGETYSDREVSPSQKALFLGNGWAKEEKVIAAAPENKAVAKRGRPRKAAA